MKSSESLSSFMPDFLKAQSAMGSAVKDSSNPFFKSTYADLNSVLDAVMKPLHDNNLAVLQSPSKAANGDTILTTLIIHSSGEWIEDTAQTKAEKEGPQAYGSVITYLRRYALQAMCCIGAEDDDAEGCTNRGTRPESAKSAPKTEAKSGLAGLTAEIKTAKSMQDCSFLFAKIQKAAVSPEEKQILNQLLRGRKDSLAIQEPA